eukprot:Em0001g3595a
MLGDGVTDSQAEAWGDEMDSRRALSIGVSGVSTAVHSAKHCRTSSSNRLRASPAKEDLRPVPHSIIQQHSTLGLTRQHYLSTVCCKEFHAVADTNFDDVGSNTGGDVVQATFDDTAEIGVDVPESASKESSVEEVSSESDEAADVKDGSDGEEMIEQLKGKFCSTVSRSEKLMILTILPKSWSQKKYQGFLVSHGI